MRNSEFFLLSFCFDFKWELWEPVKYQDKIIHSIDLTNIELYSNTIRGNSLLLFVCAILYNIINKRKNAFDKEVLAYGSY